jgi:hypothetical protein
VPLAIELPPSAVKFDHKGDKRSMQLEVLGVLKGDPRSCAFAPWWKLRCELERD